MWPRAAAQCRAVSSSWIDGFRQSAENRSIAVLPSPLGRCVLRTWMAHRSSALRWHYTSRRPRNWTNVSQSSGVLWNHGGFGTMSGAEYFGNNSQRLKRFVAARGGGGRDISQIGQWRQNERAEDNYCTVTARTCSMRPAGGHDSQLLRNRMRWGGRDGNGGGSRSTCRHVIAKPPLGRELWTLFARNFRCNKYELLVWTRAPAIWSRKSSEAAPQLVIVGCNWCCYALLGNHEAQER